MKLNGRWFPRIVDRDSGNLYPIYPPFPCSSQTKYFRKTILSHFMFFSRFMLFPTFLEKEKKMGGRVATINCGALLNLLAGYLGRPSCLVLIMYNGDIVLSLF